MIDGIRKPVLATRVLTTLVFSVLLTNTATLGQDAANAPPPPGGEPPASRPAARTPAASSPAETSQPIPSSRPEHVGPTAFTPSATAPLLREGSHLVRVAGRLEQDAPTGMWTFIIDPADGQSPSHELIVLPNTLLAEIERMIEAAPEQKLVFEMTGQVFVYRLRNYFLPTHPPLLIAHESRDSAADPDAPGGDSIADISRALEQSAGPIPRRSAANLLAEDGGVAVNARGRRLAREGHVLIARRGQIRRSPRGAFLFVFDADAEGLADPPMTILPCLLLERLERYSRQAGEQASVLLTGRVHTYDQRNYLLPTVYRIPRLRTKMTP